MDFVTKLQPVFIIAAALVGLLLGYATPFGAVSAHLIEAFLMVMLYFVFLSVDARNIRNAFRNVRFTAAACVMNFIWTPLFAYGLGLLFFGDSMDLQMGLMMLMVTPCTDWYIVFTGLAKGNVGLGTSILPLNLLLQVVLLPVYLLLFFGGSVDFDAASIVMSIVLVLVIPFCAACLTRTCARKSAFVSKVESLLKRGSDHIQLLFLCLAIVSMFSSESVAVFENPILFVRMLAPLLAYFVINFVIGRLVGSSLHMAPEDITALNFTTLARNSPLSLAIAVAAFPDRPLISLALVIGPLIELPVLSIVSSVIKARFCPTRPKNA